MSTPKNQGERIQALETDQRNIRNELKRIETGTNKRIDAIDEKADKNEALIHKVKWYGIAIILLILSSNHGQILSIIRGVL